MAADRLELEITESLALRESEGALDIVRRVRDLGPRFAIDDFGTGYSALAQMQRFPVDRLKIDRTFVSQITSAQGVAPLVSAFIGIARALRLEVVAEGVETLEQQTFLRTHGCKEAQGFLYSRPVPAGRDRRARAQAVARPARRGQRRRFVIGDPRPCVDLPTSR